MEGILHVTLENSRYLSDSIDALRGHQGGQHLSHLRNHLHVLVTVDVRGWFTSQRDETLQLHLDLFPDILRLHLCKTGP